MAALPLPFNNFWWLALFVSITLAKFQNKFTSKRGIEGQLSTRQKNWIVDSSPWNSDSRYWIPTEYLVSGTSDYWSQSSVGFRIPKFGIVRILGAKTSRIPDSASKNDTWIPFHGTRTHNNKYWLCISVITRFIYYSHSSLVPQQDHPL